MMGKCVFETVSEQQDKQMSELIMYDAGLLEATKSSVQRVRDSMSNVIIESIECGSVLTFAKSKLPHGRWLGFLNDVGISARTASEFIRFFDNRELIESCKVSSIREATRLIRDSNRKRASDLQPVALSEPMLEKHNEKRAETSFKANVQVLLEKGEWRDLLIAVLEARPEDDETIRAEAASICSNLLGCELGSTTAHSIQGLEEEEELVVPDAKAATKSLYDMFDPDGRAIVYETVVELWDKEPKKLKGKRPTVKRLPLPTFEEVKAECERRQSIIDPEAFWHGQEQSGWKLSNGRNVENWKSALTTWERLERERNPGKYVKPVERKVVVEEVEDEAVKQARVLKRMAALREKLKDMPEIARD